MINDPKSFAFWLTGFFELSGATTLNEQQVQVIKEHLALVMTKVTPSTVTPQTPVHLPYPPTYPTYPLPTNLTIPSFDGTNAPIIDVPTVISC